MEETLLHGVFGVDKTYRSTKTQIKHGGVFVDVEPKEELFLCPECGSREVIRKGKRSRQIQTLPIGFHPVYLEVEVPRCQCKACGKIFEIAPPFAQRTRAKPGRSKNTSTSSAAS